MTIVDLLQSPPYATRADANATLASNTVVLFGDSIVQFNSDIPDAGFGEPGVSPIFVSAGTYSKGIFENINMRLGAPLTVMSNLGISGETTTQIRARVPQVIQWVKTGLGWVWTSIGSNDPFNSIPLETSIRNLEAIFTEFKNNGLKVIAQTILPRSGASASQMREIMAMNNWYRDRASSLGFIVLDLWSVFADYSSVAASVGGAPAAGQTIDGIHPTPIAASQCGVLGARVLQGVFPNRYVSAGNANATDGDTDNLVFNGAMLQGTGGTNGTGSSGTLPQGWTCFRMTGSGLASVNSLVTRASVANLFPLFNDGEIGTFWRLALTASGGTGEELSAENTSIVSSRVTGLDGPYVGEVEVGCNFTSGTLYQVRVRVQFSGGATFTSSGFFNADSLGLALTQDAFVLRTRPLWTPLGTTTANFSVRISTSAGAIGDVYLGRASLRKLRSIT